MTEYLTCWSEGTDMSPTGRRLPHVLRIPLGLAHAVALGASVALCGAARVLDRGEDWPTGDPQHELCPECLALAEA